jgi:hypothetical protein
MSDTDAWRADGAAVSRCGLGALLRGRLLASHDLLGIDGGALRLRLSVLLPISLLETPGVPPVPAPLDAALDPPPVAPVPPPPPPWARAGVVRTKIATVNKTSFRRAMFISILLWTIRPRHSRSYAARGARQSN